MVDEVSDSTLSDFVDKATVLTKYFRKDEDENYYDIFDRTLISKGSDQGISEYYNSKIKEHIEQNGSLPELPNINSLADDLFQHKLRVVSNTVDTENKQFRNPFNPGESISYTNDPKTEIPEFIKRYINEMIKNLENEGIIEVSSVPIQYPSNYVFSGPLQSLEITSTGLGNSQVSNKSEETQIPTKPDSQIDSNKFLPSFLKAGDATNPNTRLAYYYLKMRDYSRALRRFVGLVRFYQGNEKEHTFVNMKAETTELNHIYSTMHEKNGDEKDRLKRCMNIEEIQKYKKIRK